MVGAEIVMLICIELCVIQVSFCLISRGKKLSSLENLCKKISLLSFWSSSHCLHLSCSTINRCVCCSKTDSRLSDKEL